MENLIHFIDIIIAVSLLPLEMFAAVRNNFIRDWRSSIGGEKLRLPSELFTSRIMIVFIIKTNSRFEEFKSLQDVIEFARSLFPDKLDEES